MKSSGEFGRVMLIHTAEHPETDLLDYTALLASAAEGAEAVVAAYPSSGVLRSLPHVARQRFEARGLPAPRIQMLPEPDLDAAWEVATAQQADLMVMRHPKVFKKHETLAHRVLSEAPCSVCFVPEGAPPKLARILAGIDLDRAGHALLASASRLCRGARAEELLAVHTYFEETGCDNESVREQFRTERVLDMFRFIAGAEMNGVSWTPLMEESPSPHRALARAAGEYDADIVLVGRQAGTPSNLASKLLWDCPSPLLQVLLPDFAKGWGDALKRVFSNPEPKFN